MNCLQITSAKIVVSANKFSPDGRLARFEAQGILPNCRKVQVLTVMPSYSAINVGPLYGYSGRATIRPEEWRELVANAPIVADRFAPITLTDELRTWAREYELGICQCPAVTNSERVHPDYRVQYDSMWVSPKAGA